MSQKIIDRINKIEEELTIENKISLEKIAINLDIEIDVINFWQKHFPQIKFHLDENNNIFYNKRGFAAFQIIKKLFYDKGLDLAKIKKIFPTNIEKDNIQERKIEVDDFIDSNIKINIDQNQIDNHKYQPNSDNRFSFPNSLKSKASIDLNARLFDYKNVKIFEIDPYLKEELLKKINSTKKNIKSLKEIIDNIGQ